MGPRKEMGVRTLFNLLGPLTNPAGTPNQVLGVFSKEWVRPLAEVLNKLGSHHVMVVHADDGMDEISIASPTSVAELKDGKITEYTIKPEDLEGSPARNALSGAIQTKPEYISPEARERLKLLIDGRV